MIAVLTLLLLALLPTDDRLPNGWLKSFSIDCAYGHVDLKWRDDLEYWAGNNKHAYIRAVSDKRGTIYLQMQTNDRDLPYDCGQVWINSGNTPAVWGAAETALKGPFTIHYGDREADTSLNPCDWPDYENWTPSYLMEYVFPVAEVISVLIFAALAAAGLLKFPALVRGAIGGCAHMFKRVSAVAVAALVLTAPMVAQATETMPDATTIKGWVVDGAVPYMAVGGAAIVAFAIVGALFRALTRRGTRVIK